MKKTYALVKGEFVKIRHELVVRYDGESVLMFDADEVALRVAAASKAAFFEAVGGGGEWKMTCEPDVVIS